MFDKLDKIQYFPVYDELLGNKKEQIRKVMEIGIGSTNPSYPWNMNFWLYTQPTYRPGDSLRAWRDYFPNATIYGQNINPATVICEDRILTRCADSTQTVAFSEETFDLIIDDGCHNFESQIATFKNFWPHLAENGIYVIEDILDPRLYQLDTCQVLPFPHTIYDVSNNQAHMIVIGK